MSLVTAACAVCGGTLFRPVYAGTITDPEDDAAAFYSSSRKRAGYLPVVRCEGCGLLMTNPRDDDETLGRIYRALEDRSYESEDRNRRTTAREHLRLVHRHRAKPGRLLDAGCATGLFAQVASERGWQVTGLDASTWAIEQARQRAASVRWMQSRLEDARFDEGSFDVVTLWDVLEHVRSPNETIGLVGRWLTPGGLLVMNAPNARSLIARLLGPRWVLLLREHLWYFAPETMARLLRQNGFELLMTRPNFVRFSLANVMARLSQYGGPTAPARRPDKLQAMLRGLSFRFPIGEMNVVARKRG